jgi:hypothetical protein
METKHLRVAVALAFVAACGASSNGNVTSNDITSFEQLALDASSASASYRTSMMGPTMNSIDACSSIHAAYYAQVQPWVSEMVQRSQVMDTKVESLGDPGGADYECVANSMMAELEHHHAMSCTSTELVLDQNEAARHSQAMNGYAMHMYDRCGQMMSAVQGHAAAWTGLYEGCAASNPGTCCGMGMKR